MSTSFNDNFNILYPKPLTEYEMKNVNGVYRDYTDTSEVISTVPSAYIANKYYRIAGSLYFTPDGTNFFSPNIPNMSDFFQVLNP